MGRVIEERFVEAADGVRLYVCDTGNRRGPPILFIHGFLFSTEAYAKQLAGPLGENFHLVAMDCRGHGRSDKPDNQAAYLDAKLLADDVARVLDALKLERSLIVGWSMGSRMALNYGWYHGYDRVAGLNLVAAVVGGPTRGPTAKMVPHLAPVLSTDDQERLETTRTFIRDCSSGELSPAEAEKFVEIAMRTPTQARIGIRNWPIHYYDTLDTLRTPLLVTHGAGDAMVPEEASRNLAGMVPGAEISIMDGGHFPFYLNPKKYDDSLAKFAGKVFADRATCARLG